MASQVRARLEPHHHHPRWHYDDPGVDKAPLAHDGLLLGLYELGSPWDPV